MSWNQSMVLQYNKEVKFQVGQLVEIDLPEVPESERECTWGVIVGVATRFPLSPKLRKITYQIKLAGNYIKPTKMLWKGLRGSVDCDAKYLTLKE